MTRCPEVLRASPESHNKVSQVKDYRRYDQGGHTVPFPPYGEAAAKRRALQERFRRWGQAQQNSLNVTSDQPTPNQLQSEIKRSVPERFSYLQLGRQASEFEPELPVRAYKEAFLDSVAENQVTIATAQTGAGKSTEFALYLLEMGYRVYETQPRRISASSLAEYMQTILIHNLGDEAEGLVGCHTAGENTVVEGKTRLTVLTDGLRLVQEFSQRDELEHEVLIIDEVHEWNSNIEVLMAQVKLLLKLKPELRVVILSATMESEKLADYFADGGSRPPVIEIPGRNYEVEMRGEPDSTIVEQAANFTADGQNTLIFLPGVREIEDTMSAIKKELESRGIMDATILPLHSKLSKKDQNAVMGMYPGPKIICATNIAQTSITIPDVTRVIMSGLERRTEIDDEGIQSLNLRPVSRADLEQQAGRCGRVEDGIAALTRLNKDTPFISQSSGERTDYPIPEILRTDVDRNVLLVASAGHDFAQLELFHPVELSVIERSKRALLILGAVDEAGVITNLGRRMIKLPMRPMYSRMVTYAEDQGYNANVRTYMAAIAAAMEVGGMQSWLRDSGREWRDLVSETNSSDHLSQLDLFIAAQQLPTAEIDRIGLDTRNVERAGELYRKVCRRSKLPINNQLDTPNEIERQQLRHAVTAGMIDYVYRQAGGDYTRLEGASGAPRKKSNRTTVIGRPRLIVGNPIGVERYRGTLRTQENIIADVTAVSAAELGQIAVGLCSFEAVGQLRWSKGRLKEVRRQLFKRSLPTGVQLEVDAAPTPEAVQEVERYVMTNSGRSLIELKESKKTLENLQRLTPDRQPAITQDDLTDLIREAMDGEAGKILDPSHIDSRIRQLVGLRRLRLDNLISPADRQTIYDNSPRTIQIANQIYKLNYSLGVPRLHLEDSSLTRGWPDRLSLPDGRPIKLIYKKPNLTTADTGQLSDRLVSIV